jgi:hypothetical protein
MDGPTRSIFPDNALQADDYLDRTRRALLSEGFNHQNALACVSLCRDEVTTGFRDGVEARWGPAFSLGGLAGLPYLGVVGMSAAIAHAPLLDRTRRLVIYAAPHLGITSRGKFGAMERPGLSDPVPTCGALSALLTEAGADGTARGGEAGLPRATEAGANGLEPRHLAERLLGEEPPQDIVGLTHQAARVIEEDLLDLLARTPGAGPARVAVATGILVQRAGKPDEFWPGVFRLLQGREATDLAL